MRDLATRWPASFEGKLARSIHSLAYRYFELGDTDASIAACDEALLIRRRLVQIEPSVYGVPIAMTMAVRASALRKAGRLTEACAEIDASMRRLLQDVQTQGKARHREAREIGSRVIIWHREAGLEPGSEALEQLRILAGIDGYGEPT